MPRSQLQLVRLHTGPLRAWQLASLRCPCPIRSRPLAASWDSSIHHRIYGSQLAPHLLAATTGDGGSEVAVLRLHAAVSYHVMNAAYSCERGERITQLQYLLQLS